MRDLNRRVRHAMARGAEAGRTRVEAELLGFRAYFEFTARAPRSTGSSARRSSSRRETLHEHYDAIAAGYVAALEAAMDGGEVRRMDPAGPRVGADGHGRAARHALDRVEDAREVPPELLLEMQELIVRVMGA